MYCFKCDTYYFWSYHLILFFFRHTFEDVSKTFQTFQIWYVFYFIGYFIFRPFTVDAIHNGLKNNIPEAEKAAQVSKIQNEQFVMEKESQKRVSELEDQTHLARMKARADADFYSAQKLTESNKVNLRILRQGQKSGVEKLAGVV